MGVFTWITGIPGPSGFGSASTAEQVTQGIDASNLTAIVTGGTSGIGMETARVLALRNAHVIIAARNMEAANEVKQLILKGVMFCPYQLSKDGIEMQFATNHLGHFLLTNLLLEKMKDTARTSGIEGRIVNLSSIAHRYHYKGGIRFEKINDRNSYCDKKAYGQSKLANILHAKELSRRLKEEGANITANSVHPGLIMTNLFKHSRFVMRLFKIVTIILWKNVPQGTATSCYVALHPNMKGVTGKYFVDCNECTPSKLARNEVLAKKLWDFSNKLIDSA
ncbi:hypothetical protein F0562_016743 [Nyssa sinensis]|uniref:Short-chain dehydrogenase TIC 32, chloroplastic n=1 Tax=Nyssa sinensis TaxID=561372 RepID=A0A5J4ZDB7_9ASTE|nr:hypothetical protein F0562_016743 [Nyssa sinensis]